MDAAGTAGRRAASRGACSPEAIVTGLRHSCQGQQERQGCEEHGEAKSRTAYHRQVIYTKILLSIRVPSVPQVQGVGRGLQLLLRHRPIATTEGYLHADVERLAAVLVRSSPLERRRKKEATVRPAMAQILGEFEELARPE